MCICRLTLALISSETSTKLLGMPTYPDRSSSLLRTLSHADWSLCCPVSTATRVTLLQLPSSQSLCLTLWLAFPSYFRSRRDLESKPFVWFRAKIDKGIVCLADHLHSVTGVLRGHDPLLGAGYLYSILTPTNSLQLTELPVALGYISVCERHICTQFNPSTVKVIPWYLPPDAPVPWLTAVTE